MTWRTALEITGAIGVPLAGGFLGSMWTVPEVKGWYKTLKRPSWNPPDWLFPPMWALLYVCMGVSSWLMYQEPKSTLPLALYGTQLLFNFAWTPLFFGLHRLDWALVDIIALDVTLIGTIITAFRLKPEAPVAAILLLPYLAWVGVATALNAWIIRNNPPQKTKGAKDDGL
ncbi:unnamed protein product [Vitrella brassicaformis CCMP3155]|uniref:Uncharacterized protein n=1 Tax=Vitrella brassicaformis (strain CCMP3155) TaxID=1169540 RepID=A0A0G4G3F8_VITBC|nr:unnamed protein product [Vitrella brassicaformis CCMP3155]|eukprot:CEM22486.1 unnamed protein product [Vitrella brassicaformis CCMP3155]